MPAEQVHGERGVAGLGEVLVREHGAPVDGRDSAARRAPAMRRPNAPPVG